jgi:hypothetical protein
MEVFFNDHAGARHTRRVCREGVPLATSAFQAGLEMLVVYHTENVDIRSLEVVVSLTTA